MIEFQLLKTQKDYPLLFHLIKQAIQGVYREVDEKTKTDRYDPLIGSKTGYLLYILMEGRIRRTLEEANILNIELRAVKNGSGMPHLEILTPYAVFMVSRVRYEGDVPRSAIYRQKYIDQTFMPEVYPELELYNPEVRAFYLITHATRKDNPYSPSICIGRLSYDQKGWSSIIKLSELTAENDIEEQITSNNQIAPLEEVKRKSQIKLRKREINL